MNPPAHPRRAVRIRRIVGAFALAVCLVLALLPLRAQRSSASPQERKASPGVTYFNEIVADEPWSIHVIKIERARTDIDFTSTLPRGAMQGLSPLTQQVRSIPKSLGSPVAAINGDFYQTENESCPGDPRGLAIVQGEVTSSPSGGASFWLDDSGQPHVAPVANRFKATMSTGESFGFGLNEERSGARSVLYTSRFGASTGTSGGMDLVLQPSTHSPPLTLQVGMTYAMQIQEIRPAGNTRLAGGKIVLSLGGSLANKFPSLATNALITLSTATAPELRNTRTAISGGPVLLLAGKVQPTNVNKGNERHPRSAMGWSEKHWFLVQVDGRQASSVGMTLQELARYMARLGCDSAMNLDGGGSSEIWLEGRIMNNPCNGQERSIANTLAIIRKPPAASASSAATN